MQQPQSRPLLGDSVSSTTSPDARRNNPVAVLTQQQVKLFINLLFLFNCASYILCALHVYLYYLSEKNVIGILNRNLNATLKKSLYECQLV